jgi:hypothetical protein
MTTLQPWHDFFMFAGGAAATLLGLVFVTASIAATIPNEKLGAGDTRDLWVNPIIWAFLRVLVVCALGLVPGTTEAVFGTIVVVLSALDLARLARTIGALYGFHRVREALTGWDWGWYAVYPVLASLMLLAAGLGLARGWPVPPHLLAGGLLGHLVVGVRTAWDLADWLAMRQ